MVYVFKRHKLTGRKKIIDGYSDSTVEEARIICTRENNNPKNTCWLEFSKYREYAEN